jgi:hypothetical protein
MSIDVSTSRVMVVWSEPSVAEDNSLLWRQAFPTNEAYSIENIIRDLAPKLNLMEDFSNFAWLYRIKHLSSTKGLIFQKRENGFDLPSLS